MPEGPEVRRSADMLHAALAGRPIETLETRLKVARAWLAEHGPVFEGRRIERVHSHGKHLLGAVEGGLFFHSHFMMWGRWMVVARDAPEVLDRDRRERARILVPDAAALLYSAPKFDVGRGDPYAELPHLAALGPDVLPYDGAFDADAFLGRLLAQPARTIGAALLDQTICAGLGNYLRAEVLFACRIDPWRRVDALGAADLDALTEAVPLLSRRAYETAGRTVPEATQAAMQATDAFVYNEPTDWNTRHWVFRRTNLPCVRCGDTIRQRRQVTRVVDDGDDKTRIIYFCPTCQGARPPEKPRRSRRSTTSTDA